MKVKVRGPVKNGETIYASLSSFPGVAMPESVITQVTSDELTMLGQALETMDSPPDKVNLVSCLVSIFMGIQSKHTAKAVNEVRSGVMVDVDTKVKKEKKKLLRGAFICFLKRRLPGAARASFPKGTGATPGKLSIQVNIDQIEI